jgi:hypothetical protein
MSVKAGLSPVEGILAVRRELFAGKVLRAGKTPSSEAEISGFDKARAGWLMHKYIRSL